MHWTVGFHSRQVSDAPGRPPVMCIVMPSPLSIDPVKLRVTVSALTDRLAKGDYEGLCQMARTSRLSPAQIERVVRDYGRQLIPLPIPAFETVDIMPVSK